MKKHVKTLNNANLKQSAAKGGCGECQASCQSDCKTSCTVANQKCEKQSARFRNCMKCIKGQFLSLNLCLNLSCEESYDT